MQQCDRIWRNARLATMVRHGSDRLGTVASGMVSASGGRILYAGPEADGAAFRAVECIDCEGRWITPGLIDCHTHLVHAGHRADEFRLRLAGATYEDVAKAGGGIASTVAATRAASEDALVRQSLPRLEALIAEGVTTVEIKSGYGLTLEHERRQLRAARRLGWERDVGIVTTLLAAHAVPPEFRGQPDGYVDLICETILPTVAAEGLVDAVDAFCETIAFTPAQTDRVFHAAVRLGLPVKIHAEQLSNSGGTAMAARYKALSADHLENLDAPGVAAMQAAGTVAVLLPTAFYFLRETRLPPVGALREAGIPMALATDCNPGTSPNTSLLLAMNMAAVLFGLTIEECLAGVTCNAAAALGLSGDRGTLEAGKRCDLAIWSIDHPAELPYRMGFNPLHARVRGGA